MSEQTAWAERLERPDVRRWIRLSLLAAGVAVGIYFIMPWLASQVYFRDYMGDYEVFWTIASAPAERLYGELRFPYPPSALVLIRPFGVLPFWWAYAAWVAAGVGAMVWAARRMAGWDAILIGFLSYAGLAVVIGGQTSLFVGALVIAGVTVRNPIVSGVLLGVAAAIKPQSVLAAPVSMIAERNFKGIVAAIVVASLQVALTLILWGPDIWVRWIENLHHFPTYLQARHLDQMDKGLYGVMLQLGLPGWLYAIGIPLGAICVWKVFRSEAGPLDRYAAFATATILISPYTLDYDLVGIAIACVALLLDQRRSVLTWVGAALIVSSVFANIGVVVLAVALTRHWWKREAA